MRLRTFSMMFGIAVSLSLMAIAHPGIGGPLDGFIEGAKKEGAVVIGVSLREKRFGKPAAEKYIQAFQERYPFLKVQLKRIGGGTERERVYSEMVSGVIKYDVVTISETNVENVMKANLAKIVNYRELGVPADLAHPKNFGVSLRTPVYGIAYNRDLVPDEVAKKFTWESCGDPRWRGKTAMDDRPRHLNVLYQDDGWGSEKTLAYAKRWSANKPIMEGSRSTAAQKLAVGAYHMICGMPHKQVRDYVVYAGAKSLAMVYPEPIPVGIGDIIYVPRESKHPNAGVLFLAWSATKEAQNLLDEVDFTGHPMYDGNEIREVTKGKRIVYASWDYSLRSDDILAELIQAMGYPVVR